VASSPPCKQHDGVLNDRDREEAEIVGGGYPRTKDDDGAGAARARVAVAPPMVRRGLRRAGKSLYRLRPSSGCALGGSSGGGAPLRDSRGRRRRRVPLTCGPALSAAQARWGHADMGASSGPRLLGWQLRAGGGLRPRRRCGHGLKRS